MAEKKNTPAATATAPSNGGAEKPQPRLTKMEAVRQALAKLGRNAKPRFIQQYVKERFGIEMSTDHISTYKGQLAKKAGRGKAKAAPVAVAVPRQTAPEPPAATKPAAGGKSGGIPLGDILTVKELVERLGAAPLHTLIDAFAQ